LSSGPTVLSNAGPLIALGKLNRLDLLADLYDQVQITQAVYTEVITQGLAHGAPEALTIRLYWESQHWPVINVPTTVLAAYIPPVILDSGETEVLALAQTIPNCLVLLDDEVARTEARRLGLQLRGTLGVLVQAYRLKHLSYAQITLLLQEIAARSDIWISAKLCQQVLNALPKP
jgi:predicted nucleic acid-binding protein